MKGLSGLIGDIKRRKWIDIDVVHVVAHKAHRGPGTSEIAK